jgi:prepilin-type processing-associated H-X9-DG protein
VLLKMKPWLTKRGAAYPACDPSAITASRRRGTQRGFNRYDLIAVLVLLWVALIVARMWFSSDQRKQRRGLRVACVNNLRAQGDAFQQDAAASGGLFPWERGVPPAMPIWLSLSNSPSNFARTFHCPADNLQSGTGTFSNLTQQNISYFLGPESKMIWPDSLILGDRNIVGGGTGTVRWFRSAEAQEARWDGTIHPKGGNIAFADGSVRQATDRDLQTSLQTNLLRTNRITLVLPR